jgi:hypothetical protein
MYCLIYCINIYILFCYVVELYALRGAEGWWGSQLAWIRNSLIIYVIGRIFVSLGELPKPPPIDLCAIYMSVVL